jgi:hypothetical protein
MHLPFFEAKPIGAYLLSEKRVINKGISRANKRYMEQRRFHER